MVARQQALTASFARQLLARWGACVVLPLQDGDGNSISDDQRTVKGLLRPTFAAVVNEHSNITYQEYVLRIPPDGLKALAAEQIVTIKETCDPEDDAEGQTYYVVNVAPANLGWHVATLQDHS